MLLKIVLIVAVEVIVLFSVFQKSPMGNSYSHVDIIPLLLLSVCEISFIPLFNGRTRPGQFQSKGDNIVRMFRVMVLCFFLLQLVNNLAQSWVKILFFQNCKDILFNCIKYYGYVFFFYIYVICSFLIKALKIFASGILKCQNTVLNFWSFLIYCFGVLWENNFKLGIIIIRNEKVNYFIYNFILLHSQ